MSAATDKARFFLEQSVPELKELEKKQIFTKDEISSIIKKRSDFEHKLNARGARPGDFVRYAEYEMNLDLLRRKRVQRLGIRSAGHSGQRRIFFILDRATRKFHGDIGLWVQYIEYAREQKAHKKLSQIFTDALRLHPTNPDLWIYAAKYAFEDHADMIQARSYMQRGLRFCKGSRKVWLDYAKLELIYIAKLVARQRILGLDKPIETAKEMSDSAFVDPDADMVSVPPLTGEDINPTGVKGDEVDEVALQNLTSTPALSGAIPLAIFDSGWKHFEEDDRFAHEFYHMALEFDSVPCTRKILAHIVDDMMASKPDSHLTQICFIRLPTTGISVTSPEFPRALGASLERLRKYKNNPKLARLVRDWLQPLAQTKGLDPALQKVLAATIRTVDRALPVD